MRPSFRVFNQHMETMSSPGTSAMRRTQVWLPLPVIDWLKEQAGEEGVSYAELVRRAIDMYRDFKEAERSVLDRLDEMDRLHESITEGEAGEGEILARLDAVEAALARIEAKLEGAS